MYPCFYETPVFHSQFVLQSGPSAAPTGFEIVSIDSSSVTLTWNELPCFAQNGPLLGYVISYTSDGKTTPITELVISNIHQLTGLTPCTRYTLNIAALNDAGAGVSSMSLVVVTSENGKV